MKKRFSGLAKSVFLTLALLSISGSLALIACLYLAQKPALLENVQYGKVVLDARGKAMRTSLSPDDKYRLPVKLENIAPEAVRAVLHYEDRYFYYHPGINPFSIFRAFLSCLTSPRRPGASTITMQTARLLHVPVTSTIKGKLEQIWTALLLEFHYSKEEILEAYFNLAPYGGNIEGIEAAARIYFHKSANELTPLECFALAVIPQNPVDRNPITGKDFQNARKRLEESLSGTLSETRLQVFPPSAQRVLAPHLSSELIAGNCSTQKFNTWIQPEIQTMLEKRLRLFADRGRRYGIENAAAILVHTPTMQVHAIAGSASFYRDSISGQIDGTRARRSPGSTLKPFIYALALDQGLIHPHTILPDSPRSFGGYDPENFDGGFVGPLNASEALRSSRNLPAIYLSGQLDAPGLYDFLKSAEISFPHGPEYYGLALALGGAEISMRELVTLYAMLANQGLWHPLRFLKKEKSGSAKRLLSKEAAWLSLWMLERENAKIGSLPVRYKTGTSNGFRDAWTAGIFGEYALVVWVGNFDNSSSPYLVGAETALPLFMEICHELALSGTMRDPHPALEASLNLQRSEICASTGDFSIAHCKERVETIFIPGVSPVHDTGILRKVLIDRESGLRACVPEEGKTEEKWFEFWPTDMLAHFERAGVYKLPVPDYLPECRQVAQSARGKNPRIILPKKNLDYQRGVNTPSLNIPLKAAADTDVKKLFWYADDQFIGSASPEETLIWKTSIAGSVALRVVDEKGRRASQDFRIVFTP